MCVRSSLLSCSLVSLCMGTDGFSQGGRGRGARASQREGVQGCQHLGGGRFPFRRAQMPPSLDSDDASVGCPTSSGLLSGPSRLSQCGRWWRFSSHTPFMLGLCSVSFCGFRFLRFSGWGTGWAGAWLQDRRCAVSGAGGARGACGAIPGDFVFLCGAWEHSGCSLKFLRAR